MPTLTHRPKVQTHVDVSRVSAQDRANRGSRSGIEHGRKLDLASTSPLAETRADGDGCLGGPSTESVPMEDTRQLTFATAFVPGDVHPRRLRRTAATVPEECSTADKTQRSGAPELSLRGAAAR